MGKAQRASQLSLDLRPQMASLENVDRAKGRGWSFLGLMPNFMVV